MGTSTPASRTPRWYSTKRSSRRTTITRRWNRARRWRTGRTARSTSTARRRAWCRPSPRRAQSQPGGMQGIMLMEPLLAKAARKLNLDQVAIRRINAPEGKAPLGPANVRGQRGFATSAFVKEALDRGAQQFRWEQRKAVNGKRQGTKVRGVGVAVSAFV